MYLHSGLLNNDPLRIVDRVRWKEVKKYSNDLNTNKEMFGKKKTSDSAGEWTKTGSFLHKPSRGWLHSDNSLQEGGVCYAVKYVGCLQVLKSMRTLQYEMRQQVTREAILRCSEAAGYHLGRRKKAGKNIQKLLADIPSMRNSGVNVNMTVSSAGIKLTSIENGRLVTNHDMQGISFASGGEKDCIDMIGYVAKDEFHGRACFVVDCGGGLAYDVINTIGQAFEIRFKLFLQNPPLATEVPERFSESIFESEEPSYEMEYEQPKDDGQHVKLPTIYQSANSEQSTYMALDPQTTTNHELYNYDNPNKALSGRGYDVPKRTNVGYAAPTNQTNRRTTGNGVSGHYDNPEDLRGASANRNGIGKADSLKFAAGACFDNHDTSAFYENPLAVPLVPQRVDSLEHRPTAGGTETPYDNPLAAKNNSGQGDWATFDDDVAPTPPPIQLRQHLIKVQWHPCFSGSLEAEVWYHGPMSRAEAELLLEDEGDFLVRESHSKAGQYVLSGVQKGQPRHLLLVDPEGHVRTKDRVFSSVQELIAYHVENKLPIISAGSQVTISHPVHKH
ncbi:PREDICTED: SHC-transforming protein 1-like [Acropora digitifera]|uniref:SHC-transforming protein 1-like n=1 Tax=Acropora digitifera TaxID=70779 RepID=UPI00077AEB91|nr:PREDICTED: SHC-transforming protein 1-like [Acropora digitifera]